MNLQSLYERPTRDATQDEIDLQLELLRGDPYPITVYDMLGSSGLVDPVRNPTWDPNRLKERELDEEDYWEWYERERKREIFAQMEEAWDDRYSGDPDFYYRIGWGPHPNWMYDPLSDDFDPLYDYDPLMDDY